MAIFHRFHLKLDKSLLRAINKSVISNWTTTKSQINFILQRMLIYTDAMDLSRNKDFIKDDCTGFSEDFIVPLEHSIYNKLRYLHFRFKTYSIADIIRKLLRLYLIRLRGKIDSVLRYLKGSVFSGMKVHIEFEAHMCLEIDKPTRTITLNSHNRISSISGFI